MASLPENCSRLISKGVLFSSVLFISPAICPSSDSIPTAVTTATPCPPVIWEPEKIILVRLASGTSSSLSTRISFSTSWDSPVRELSLRRRSTASKSLPSAGARSPHSSTRISPTTTSSTGIFSRFPSRITLASGADKARRPSKDFWAF